MSEVCELPTVIGLVGAIGSGKTSVAKYLTKSRGYTQFTMSITAKAMLYQLGLTEFDLEGPQAHREQPHPLLGGKSPRFAITSLATGWGRETISEDLWVNAMQERIIRHRVAMAKKRSPPFDGVVIDGIRFPNEAEMVRRMGGVLWRIHRPDVEKPLSPFDNLYHGVEGKFIKAAVGGVAKLVRKPVTHESEFHYRSMSPDVALVNDGTQDELFEQVAHHLRLGYCS